MTVTSLFSPEEAAHPGKTKLRLVRNDGGTIQRRNPVVYAVDQKQGLCGSGCIRSAAAQSPQTEAAKLIQEEKGVVHIGKTPEAVIDRRDGCLHGAVDPADADSRINGVSGQNIAHGIAAHAVAKEDYVLTTEIVLLTDKTQRGIQIRNGLGKASAGTSLTAKTARIVKGEHGTSGGHKITDLGTVGKSTVA